MCDCERYRGTLAVRISDSNRQRITLSVVIGSGVAMLVAFQPLGSKLVGFLNWPNTFPIQLRARAKHW